MHVFATFAQAVHVVLLKRYLPNQRGAQFKGKYYIFQEQQGASAYRDDVISGTSASKLLKKGGVFQSGWVENIPEALGFAATRGSSTVPSSERMQGTGITLGTTAVGSPTELIPCERARTQALETKAPCGLGSELLEAPGIGAPEGIIPTAAQDTWRQNLPVSEYTAGSSAPMHNMLLETPLLGAFQGADPSWQPAGASLESSQPVLSPTLRPKGLGHVQFTIKPTGTGDLDLSAHSEPLSPGTGKGQEGTGAPRDSTASLEKDGSHALLSVPDDGLAKGLMPSLRSPSDVVTRDHLQLLPERSQSSLGLLSKPKPELGTTGLHHTKLVDIFPLGNVSELGPPWVTEYFPIRSCHLIFRGGSGLFYLPLHADIKPNIWCNWTIWAGPQKHIVIYVQGFQGSHGCGHNQDKIIFQGVSSSVETKVVFACHNRGTLIFAARATEVQVLFLSGSGFRNHEYRYFRGQYYVFRDSETVGLSSNATAAPQETSKKESGRTGVTKGLLFMPTAPPGPPAAPADGRIQPDIVSSKEESQHSPDLMEDGQSGANRSEHGQDEIRLERNPKDGGSKGRETEDDMLVEPAPAGQDTGGKAEPPALELAKGDTEPETALVTMVPCHPAGSPCSHLPSSSVGVSDTSPALGQASGSPSEVAAAAHVTQTPELAEPPLNTSTEPPLYPSPGVTAADVVSLGGRTEELFVLPGMITESELQKLEKDVLFEVTVEIKAKDWIPHGGNEFQRGLLESLKNHIQKNLKLSANKVSEIKLRGIKRTRDANLLLTFWLHLEPEERNVSLLLHNHLELLLGSSVGVEKLQLVSLFVEDVNECQAGLGLCGEGAECFNGVGTYLCRCKKDYEDHSPSESGTLCIRSPRAGVSAFLRHADTLVGAALVAGLVLLVAFSVLCVTALRGQAPRRSPGPEEPAARAVEEPAMELHDLGECLRLDPFQLKLRARSPEWLWSVRAHPGQAEQPAPLPGEPAPR
ncbi:hypothetical protein RLOC_00005220 [Lonchura striata]|uniref:EGF-like domain-containing protein n=1 Tax=Lonchura striata TaxID=40157 RepID=A0A218UHQ3_9PASE|nr:hypothetical protein RLOC_00005220 [Lonchura striata domestica]